MFGEFSVRYSGVKEGDNILENLNFEEIKERLRGGSDETIVAVLKNILELRSKKQDISLIYNEVKLHFTNENAEIRKLTAEIFGAETEHLKLIFASSEEKLRELDFLADVTVPNMVQDRDERNIEYAMPFLAALLFDVDEKVRISAIRTIRAAQDDNQDITLTLPAIIDILSKKNDKTQLNSLFLIRDAVMSPFQMLDITDYIPALEKTLKSEYEEAKWATVDILTYFYAKSGRWYKVAELLQDIDKDIRQEAAGTLTRLYCKIDSVYPVLKKMLSDKIEDVRIVAARTIVYKSDKKADVIKTIPIVMKELNNQKEENRIYASNIVYSMINIFLNKNKKDPALNEKLWEPIAGIIPDIEKHLDDPNIKVVENILKALIRYYLCNNLNDKAIELLKNSTPENKDVLIKNIEPKEIPKSLDVNRYIIELQREKLKARFKKNAEDGIKELRLTGESFSTIKLLEIPVEVCEILSLTKLNVTQNNLKYLPEEIGNLVNLETLTATCNKLQTLPNSIGKLMNLKDMWLYKNELKTVPKDIGNLKELKYLQLSYNKIKSLPEEIGDLSGLTDLDLQENALKKLPDNFVNLSNLQRLDLRGNNIKKFPVGMEKLNKLESIMLNGNGLSEIPEFVFKLPKLKYLGFSGNKLEEIPIELTNLVELETLEMRNNFIKIIPREIKKLYKLRTFDLVNNRLESVPEELKNMRNLKFLHLYPYNEK